MNCPLNAAVDSLTSSWGSTNYRSLINELYCWVNVYQQVAAPPPAFLPSPLFAPLPPTLIKRGGMNLEKKWEAHFRLVARRERISIYSIYTHTLDLTHTHTQTHTRTHRHTHIYIRNGGKKWKGRIGPASFYWRDRRRFSSRFSLL